MQLARVARQRVGERYGLVRPGNLHLTLVFMGSMTAQQRVCAEGVADTITGQAFELRLELIGYWPRPQVVWLAPQKVPEPLRVLIRQLNRGLAACGYRFETRPFRAHVTLARKVTEHFLTSQIAPLVWRVKCFYLMQSVTHPGGVQYQVLHTWSLLQRVDH